MHNDGREFQRIARAALPLGTGVAAFSVVAAVALAVAAASLDGDPTSVARLQGLAAAAGLLATASLVAITAVYVALTAAQVREATALRLEQRSARLVAIPSLPVGPVSRPPFPSVDNLDAIGLPFDHEYAIPRDAATVMHFGTEVFLRNDGVAAAVVTIEDGTRMAFVPTPSRNFSHLADGPPPFRIDDRRFTLLPGSCAVLGVFSSLTLNQAANRAGADSVLTTHHVMVDDFYDDGIGTSISLDLVGTPFTQAPNDPSRWMRTRPPPTSDAPLVVMNVGMRLRS